MIRSLAVVVALSLHVLMLPAVAAAQTLYVVSPPAAGAAPARTGWTNFTFNDDDDGEATLALPFPFTFYGVNYTSVDVSTNGLLLFNNTYCGASSGCYSNTTIPSASDPDNFIAFWWEDMEVSTGTRASSTSSGAPGDRIFSIRLEDWEKLSGGVPRTVQIELLERSGAIMIYYGDIASGSAGDEATVGIEDASGSSGLHGLSCSATSDQCETADWPEGRYVVIAPAVEPDLMVMEVIGSALTPIDISTPQGLVPGFELDVSTTVKNQGQNPANGFIFEVYLSSDATISPASDTLLATYSTPESLAGRTSATYNVQDVQFVRPQGSGNFHIGVILDPLNAVSEAVEVNNTGISAAYVIGADLVGNVSGPTAGGPGDTIDLRVIVSNRGTDPVGTFTYNVYLSPDATLDRTSDTLFPGFPKAIASIGGGETIDQIVQAQLPGAPDGAYYYIIDVDPQTAAHANGDIAESNESNNWRASTATVTLSAADLAIEEISVLSPIEPYPATTNAYFGEHLRVSFTLKNTGGATASDFFVAVVLSDNAVITTHDLDMTPTSPELQHLTFAGDETRQIAVNLTVPERLANGDLLEDGSYYIGVIVDPFGRIAESNETNNLNRAENEILIRQPAMDLAPVRVEAPAAAAVGERMPVLRVIRNLGNRGTSSTGPAAYRYVLSSNEIISVEDIPLQILPEQGALMLDGRLEIGIGGEDVATDIVQVPSDISPGTYFVGLVTDPLEQITELDETNNAVGSLGVVEVAASSLTVLTSSLPDAMVGASYLYQLAAAGGFGDYTWSLEEQGALPAGLTMEADGSIHGQPSEAGASIFTVRVTSGGRNAFARMVLRTVPPSGALGVLSSQLPTAVRGVDYSVELVGVGGVRPYLWMLEEGTVPLGLELTQAGKLQGKLTRAYADPVSFKVSVTDSLGNRVAATLQMRAVEPGTLYIATVKLAEAMTGVSYVQQLQPMNSELGWKVRSGTLPDGLKLANGAITGVPTRAGVYPLLIEVSDAEGHSDSADFILTVLARPASFTPVTIPEGRPGEAYFLDLSATALPHSTFELHSGQLPPGLSLNSSGRITGTVAADAAPGSYDFVTLITEQSGQELLVPLTIRIVPMPVVIESESSGCSTGGVGLVPLALLFALLAPFALRRRARGVLAGAALALAVAAPGQALARYELAVTSQVPFVPIAGTPIDIASATSQATVTLPFTFRFWGTNYSSLNIGCRGYVAFGAGNASNPISFGIPSTAASAPLIAAWWGNWDCQPGAVSYSVDGVAPFRVMTFQWRNVWYQPDTPATSQHGATFQIKLYETTAKVELAYGPSNHGLYSDPTKIKAAVGIQANGALGMPGLTCTTQQSTSGSGARCEPSSYQVDSVIRFTQPADLSMPRVYAEETGYAGVPMRMGATLRNGGGSDATRVAVRFFLSADAALDSANDATLGSSIPIDLAVGQRRDVIIAPQVPAGLAPGDYFLFAKVDPDNALSEDDENNNVGPSGGWRFSIGAAMPDLVPGVVTVPASAKPGDRVSIQHAIRNIGNALVGPCGSDSDCGGLVCSAGRCRPTCGADDTCSGEMVCNASTGVCDILGCSGPEECPASEECDAGACKTRHIVYGLYLSDNPIISLADTPLLPGAGLAELATGISPFGLAAATDEVTLPTSLAAGTYYVGLVVDPAGQLPEISDVNNASIAASKLVVVSDELTMLTSALPDAVVQSPYGVLLEASGGSGIYSFAIASGELPPGLGMTREGLISGVPEQERSEPYAVEIEVASGGKTARASLSIRVQPSNVPLTLITQDLPAAEYGRPYEVQLAAVGGKPPYSWSLAEGGNPPPGIVLGSDGMLEGVPELDRPSADPEDDPEFAFQVQVTDSAGAAAAQPLVLKVVSPVRLQISTSKLPEALLGTMYDLALHAVGGRAPYAWSLVQTRLLPSSSMEEADPAAELGLKIISEKSGARLTGVPRHAGSWVVTFKVVDSTGAEDNATFLLEVSFEKGLEIDTQALPDAIVGNTYYTRLMANGGQEAETIKWSIVCRPVLNDKGEVISCPEGLPPGFSLTADGILSTSEQMVPEPEADASGTRAARTVYSFLIKAQDEQHRTALKGLSVTVRVDEAPTTSGDEGCGCGHAGAALPALWAAMAAAAALLRRRRS